MQRKRIMELTDRQLSILSYIIYHPEGITGGQLAKQMGISLRTVQTEINAINGYLAPGQQSIDHARTGYIAQGFSGKALEEISGLMENKHTRIMPMNRSNTILCVLLFERDYMSMEKLAERIYVSKSAVFKEFENVNILKKYVTVSRKRGLIISMPESEKRNLLVKCFDKDMAQFYAPQLKERYEELDMLFREMLPEIFRNHNYPVSGEAMRSFRRHLIITLLRGESGFELEKMDQPEKYSAMLLEIAERVSVLVGADFSPDDMADCQKKLNGLNTLAGRVAGWRECTMREYEQKLDGFQRELKDVFGLELVFDGEERQSFLLYILKAVERSRGGHVNSNFLKREIHRRYPMSVHLILECFIPCFSVDIPEPEISNLALYLAGKLDKGFYRPECVIVSGRNPSILYHLKEQIQERYGHLLNGINIVQDYCCPKESEYFESRLVLTTEEAAVLQLSGAVLIKPFLTEKNLCEIAGKLEAKTKEGRERCFKARLRRYGADRPQICREYLKDMKEFLQVVGEERPENSYEFVLDVNAVLFPKIHYDGTKNSIRIYLLKYPFMHRGTPVHMAVFSDYQAKSMEMKSFYDCVRMILNPDHIRCLEKEYLI